MDIRTTVDASDFDATLARLEAAVSRLEALARPVTPVVDPPAVEPTPPPVVIVPPVVSEPPPVVDPLPVVSTSRAFFDKWSTSEWMLPASYEIHPKPADPTDPSWVYDESTQMWTSRHRPTCGQLRAKLKTLIDSGTYTAITPIKTSEGWKGEPALFVDPENGRQGNSIPVSKFHQIAIRGDAHFLEKRLHAFGGDKDGLGSIGFRGGVKVYGELGPGARARRDIPKAEKIEDFDGGGDSAQPMQGELAIYHGRMTWFIDHIEIGAAFPALDLYSCWTWDEDRGLMQVYNQLPIRRVDAYSGVWVQFGGEHRAGPELNRWVPWVLQLWNAPIDQVLADVKGLR
jgi:hypothetical protein